MDGIKCVPVATFLSNVVFFLMGFVRVMGMYRSQILCNSYHFLEYELKNRCTDILIGVK